jgi:hypothetical protein
LTTSDFHSWHDAGLIPGVPFFITCAMRGLNFKGNIWNLLRHQIVTDTAKFQCAQDLDGNILPD